MTTGALEAMRMSVARGRGITAADDATAPLAALVNETMARTLWPGVDPIGRRFRMASSTAPWATVVGVVRDVRSTGIGEPPGPEFYVPHAQFLRFGGWLPRYLTLVVRTAGDPAALAASVRRALQAADPELAVAEVRTMRQVVDRSVARPRFTMLLLSGFGGMALLLAAVGVYAVISYSVAQRTRELGIRVALGAQRRDVLGLVVRQGIGLAAAGVAVGLVGALATSRLLRSLLFGVSPVDPLTFAVIPLLLLAVALLASVLPARRATRVSPIAALRAE
jgi:predicted permease